ncbi:SusC/RagA family TonB-linked outer membrane protein [Paradesertivirga mongoliensis]|uniref:SusC/RagA family TonB-linked outer membrane protein n=1 Tax=Paradesertivirga mongoliensis TaxID=2100740 RepID=A0ABW4ZL73_9SPHI|nr:TonB-dependent receptor [Pedobacter mongoliensis]
MRKVLLVFSVLYACMFSVQAQTKSITGKVTDVANEPLIGVSVTIKGTSQGTTTDEVGSFTINVPSGNQTLVFKYLGFKNLEVEVGSQTQLNVKLEEEVTKLNEVVVIGYGSVLRKDLTGSVATVDADVIKAAPVSSALEAIKGRVAGVSISATEGSPDAEMTVRVRGGGSITQSNEPLYIIDGFPANSISDIAPGDIESISILKDASSTAIYGARGANGVVLVTTKNSKTGTTTISYDAFTGVRKLANKLDVLSPLDYATWQYERALLDNSIDDYTKYFGNYQDIGLYSNVQANDWQNLVFGRTGTTFNQNLSISGGGEKTKFTVSHSLVKDKAIMQGSAFERQNINFKLNQKLFDRLTLDLNARYADAKTEGSGVNEQNEKSSSDSRLKSAMIYPPFPVAGLTSSTDTDPDFNLFSPLVSIADNDQFGRRKTFNLNGAVTYELFKGFRLRSEIGYDNFRNDQDRFYGATTYYVNNTPAAEFQGLPGIIFANTTRNTLRNTNTLNYDFKSFLSSDHNLTLLLGHEYVKTQGGVLTTVVHGFPEWMSFQQARNFSTFGKSPYSIDNNQSDDNTLLSFFSRANYDYKGKYLLSASFRADGSSKFAEGNRLGYFPAFSGGWRISAEDFMEGTRSWLSDLKLRASYGEAGNNAIPSGVIRQPFANATTSWVNGTNSFWAPSKTMANAELQWETTISRNLGLDFAIFDSRVTGTVETYRNNTKNLLIPFPVGGTGYDIQFRNIGETRNKGVELTLNWNALRKKNFDLSLNANISANKNKVMDLGGVKYSASSGWASTEVGIDYLVEVGSPIGGIYGYKSAGRYEVSDFASNTGNTWVLKGDIPTASAVVGTIRPGSMKLQDLNGDNKIDATDRTIIGNANPLHTGGFSINSRIFQFDLGAYFNWSYGNDIYNANKIEYTSTSKYSSRNMIGEMASGSRWTNLRADGTISNDPAELEAMNTNTTLWSPYMSRYVLSDWAVEDGSFLRLGTLTLGYTLPKSVLGKLRANNMRVYASGYNLFRLTNYSGFDPEVSTRRQTHQTPGVDYSAYPRSRSFMFGVNLNF